MKKLFKTLALAVALMAFVGCGSVNIDRINEICNQEEISTSDCDYLLDQLEALAKKFQNMGPEDFMKLGEKDIQEVQAIEVIYRTLLHADLTDAQEDRLDEIEDKYKD